MLAQHRVAQENIYIQLQYSSRKENSALLRNQNLYKFCGVSASIVCKDVLYKSQKILKAKKKLMVNYGRDL